MFASHGKHGDTDPLGRDPQGSVEDVRGHWVGVASLGTGGHGGTNLRHLVQVPSAVNLDKICLQYFIKCLIPSQLSVVKPEQYTSMQNVGQH